jgi:hypothetical protein
MRGSYQVLCVDSAEEVIETHRSSPDQRRGREWNDRSVFGRIGGSCPGAVMLVDRGSRTGGAQMQWHASGFLGRRLAKLVL